MRTGRIRYRGQRTELKEALCPIFTNITRTSAGGAGSWATAQATVGPSLADSQRTILQAVSAGWE